MSLLQNTSCPAQPCLTLAQLRDQFFIVSYDTYKTAVFGNTALIFLPGTHAFTKHLSFFACNVTYSLSLSGLANHSVVDTVITGSHQGTTFIPGLQFEGIAVIVTHLQFFNCTLFYYSASQCKPPFFMVNHVAMNDALL